MADRLPRTIAPMLAKLVGAPFDSPEWLFETKYDGVRGVATVDAKRNVSLVSRNSKDLLKKYPSLAEIGEAFRSVPVIVDGEVVSLDARGKSSFQRLQNLIGSRGATSRTEQSIKYAVFDVMYAEGRDLRKEPLEDRKRILESLIVAGHGVVYSEHIVGHGKEAFAAAARLGLEGIIGKRRDSMYSGTRSGDWVKVKVIHEQEFVIGGWSEPSGSRQGFGALLLGVYQEGKLIYVGHVGTGFNTARLRALSRQLKSLKVEDSPFTTTPKSNAPTHFVRPKLVAEIKFSEWTKDGLLRQPVFLGLRDDKPARDVVREGG